LAKKRTIASICLRSSKAGALLRTGEEHFVQDLETLEVDLEFLDRLLERLVRREGRLASYPLSWALGKYIDRTGPIQERLL
jgi:hypothetical protein